MHYDYDPFQKKSIEAVNKGHSVLVSAPTGSGKTAIAEYVIERALEKGERVVYTAPIKAISNQKYRDFIVNYPGKVGLLTGDVSIDPDALVLIMTTEIYRNQLFENPEKHRNTSWVIFDEVHYLDDYERGTVWEEAIMFSHPQTKFLCLSATAPNIAELAQWIESVHQHSITVVLESQRPVELRHHFQCQNLIYDDVHRLKKDGYMGQNLWASGHGRGGGGRGGRHPRGRMRGFGKLTTGHGGWQRELRAKPNSTHDLLRHLIERDRLPCLYFAFGRKRVEELAHEHMHLNLLSPEDRDINRMQYDQLVKKYDLELEKSAVEMGRLVEHGIAFHHAGMLPTLKEVVERLFTAKRIRLIFTTETFALGINMPARTVVFDELRKFYGFGFDNLTTRDYFQMAGRAGRRGIDDTGFVYSRVNPHFISIQAISRVVHGDMEPIMSQFNASYATLLNLYRHLGRRLVDVYPKSLHYFQSQAKKQRKALEKIEHKLELLTRMGYLTETALTEKGEFASCMYGYELILSELLESGFLDHLNATELCVLVAALVYEPRKNEMPRGFPVQYHHLEKQARRVLKKIHEFELGLNISPETKEPHFHLTAAMEAWMQGVDFHEMGKYTDIDEGIIIRYFRMVIQILRQLESAPAVTGNLRELTQKALPLINRDIVDAEKLLRSL